MPELLIAILCAATLQPHIDLGLVSLDDCWYPAHWIETRVLRNEEIRL